MIEWNRSIDGFLKSKCGRFHIYPLYYGKSSPRQYELSAINGELFSKPFETEQSAKDYAEQL